MGHRNKTFVIFDGDNDKWAYGRMKGWKSLEHIDFKDAHDEYPLSVHASNEDYIKGKLRKRFLSASQMIILIGKSTKYLYKYVRWELEVAQNLNIPIIVVNLNGDRKQNTNTCPSIIRNSYVVHIPFRMKIIKYAFDSFLAEFNKRSTDGSFGGRYYNTSVYSSLILND